MRTIPLVSTRAANGLSALAQQAKSTASSTITAAWWLFRSQRLDRVIWRAIRRFSSTLRKSSGVIYSSQRSKISTWDILRIQHLMAGRIPRRRYKVSITALKTKTFPTLPPTSLDNKTFLDCYSNASTPSRFAPRELRYPRRFTTVPAMQLDEAARAILQRREVSCCPKCSHFRYFPVSGISITPKWINKKRLPYCVE